MPEPNDHSPDHLERHCRMLGHEVRFGYCRLLPEGRPCRLIIECWQGHFDIRAFLQARYSSEDIESFLAPPKPKLTSLIELIERAKASQNPVEDNKPTSAD